MMPMNGNAVGERKLSRGDRSRRSTNTAKLTTVNTPSSNKAVVPPSVRTASELAKDTRMISPNAKLL